MLFIIREDYFFYDLLKKITRLNATDLSSTLWELKRKQILIEDDNKYRFYHMTLPEAVNKKLSYQRKIELNYRVGKVIEAINKGRLEKIIEDLAYYFINAKDRKKGIAYGLRAAKRSSEKYANEQAIRFYKGVLGLLDNKDIKRKFKNLQKLGQIEVFSDYYDDAIEHGGEALRLKIDIIDKKSKFILELLGMHMRKGENIIRH